MRREKSKTNGLCKDEIYERALKTLTTGKDVASFKADEYPFQSSLLMSIGNPEEEEVLGFTDPLTNEIIILEMPEEFKSWEESVLTNEVNHSFVMSQNPQRSLLFLSCGFQREIAPEEIIDDWRELLESIALYENLQEGLPLELKREIDQRLQKNSRMRNRIEKFAKIINTIPGYCLSEITDKRSLIHNLGSLIASCPLIVFRERIYSNFDVLLDSLMQYNFGRISEEETPEFHLLGLDDISTFLLSLIFFFNSCYSSFVETIMELLAEEERKEKLYIVSEMFVSLESISLIHDLPAVLSIDKGEELKPFISGLLHYAGVIGPIIYKTRNFGAEKEISLCLVTKHLDTRIELFRNFSAFISKIRPKDKSDPKFDSFDEKVRNMNKLFEVAKWIQNNCLANCIGKQACPLMESGKVYEITKKLLIKHSASS